MRPVGVRVALALVDGGACDVEALHAVIDSARAAGLAVDQGADGPILVGSDPKVLAAMPGIVQAAVAAGAGRVSIRVSAEPEAAGR